MKIDVNFWFFKILSSEKIRKCQIENTWLFFLLVEYWNITHIFTLILSTMRRKIKLSGNFASPKMLQSVAWLSFSVFGGSLKFENWKFQSIFNFCFSDETFQIVDRTTQEGGGGVHSHVNFSPSTLSPGRSASLHALGEFICPCPCPFPSHATLLWKRGGSGKFVVTAWSLFRTWTTSALST